MKIISLDLVGNIMKILAKKTKIVRQISNIFGPTKKLAKDGLKLSKNLILNLCG